MRDSARRPFGGIDGFGDGRAVGEYALERARQRAESGIRPLFRFLCPQPTTSATCASPERYRSFKRYLPGSSAGHLPTPPRCVRAQFSRGWARRALTIVPRRETPRLPRCRRDDEFAGSAGATYPQPPRCVKTQFRFCRSGFFCTRPSGNPCKSPSRAHNHGRTCHPQESSGDLPGAGRPQGP